MSFSKIGIIVQARMNSSRLPGKVLLPFYGEKNILQIIIDRLKLSKYQFPIVIATSNAVIDDAIEALAKSEKVNCFRGDEENVLNRFISCSKHYNFDKIIRVCADNPFIDVDFMDELIRKSSEIDFDYYSFLVNDDLPAIKSHWGIFTEFVSVKALEKVKTISDEKIHHEHVTNYIYEHPMDFKVFWEKAPFMIYGITDVRFTIDTKEDFLQMAQLWSLLVERGITANFRRALEILNEFPDIKNSMLERINFNTK